MDFGIVTAKIDEIGYITHAENLGYSHCWVTDSQMIRSNCWAVLALAAQQTRRMRLGTGVNVPGLRLAPVAANGIATINRLAPGRCFIGLGTGHTAMRTLGQKPMRLGPFKEYVQTVRALLRGEEVDYTLSGETHPIRFQMREHRFIDLDHPIPVYLAGFGPKAQALAGELGDGLISGLPRGGTVPEMLANARRGAGEASLCRRISHRGHGHPGDAPAGKAGLRGIIPVRRRGLSGLPTWWPGIWAGRGPAGYAGPVWKGYMDWLDKAPPRSASAAARQPTFDPRGAVLTADLIRAPASPACPNWSTRCEALGDRG
jgi:hypothetical protein